MVVLLSLVILQPDFKLLCSITFLSSWKHLNLQESVRQMQLKLCMTPLQAVTSGGLMYKPPEQLILELPNKPENHIMCGFAIHIRFRVVGSFDLPLEMMYFRRKNHLSFGNRIL